MTGGDRTPNTSFVGLNPWLPWPLSVWAWWTRPVPAQRLAVLRIGLAAILFVDVFGTYGRWLFDFFGPGSLGSTELFAWYGDAPRYSWSLLRGPGDPLLSLFSLISLLLITGLLVLALFGRASAADPGRPKPLGKMWLLWSIAAALAVTGIWCRVARAARADPASWIVPLIMWVGASGFFLVELFVLPWLQNRKQLIDPDRFRARAWSGLGWLVSTALLLGSMFLWHADFPNDPQRFPPWLTEPWHERTEVLAGAMILWLAAIALLLVGLGTRLAAVLTWTLSMSFANLNPNIDNAGDTVRTITLFYLMLCPCGAVWSLDRLIQKWRGQSRGPVLVSPWALRLLFMQMVWIYFANGLYKMTGDSWQLGNSMYYVMCDLTLTRFSYLQLPVPLVALQAMTWLVLVWEVGFPLLVLIRWTRIPALVMGVLFHLGIFATMELGGFAPYMFVLYLPLLPWGGNVARRSAS